MTTDYGTEYKIPYERHKPIEPIANSIDGLVEGEDYFIVPTLQESSKPINKGWNRDIKPKAQQKNEPSNFQFSKK